MKYKLFYKELELGSVVQVDFDFPNLFGYFKLVDQIEEQEVLWNYISYSISASKLVETNYSEWEKFSIKEEAKYLDLIASEEWTLLDENGEAHGILIPNFCDNNEIVWRWS